MDVANDFDFIVLLRANTIIGSINVMVLNNNTSVSAFVTKNDGVIFFSDLDNYTKKRTFGSHVN